MGTEPEGAVIAETVRAYCSRRGGVIEVRLRRAVIDIEAATVDELGELWELVGRVQKEYAPGGARIEFTNGSGEPLVIRLYPVVSRNLSALRGFVPGQEVHFADQLRRGLESATRIDIVAAFVMARGIDAIVTDLSRALARGAMIRVLTGDTLTITEPEGLSELLSLSIQSEHLRTKLYCCPRGQSFHAKAYIFVDANEAGVAYVGSSNLSASALEDGIEWNLRTIESAAEFLEIQRRFERLWADPAAHELTPSLLAEYAVRHRTAPRTELVELFDRVPPRPEPHAIQREALARLQRARERGERRGLVVLATGLGKTLLSAFDFAATGWRRALFVAHREEILEQACAQWGRVMPHRARGRYFGGKRERAAEIVFASIQALTRSDALETFEPDEFDYVVIDEFHHAEAKTYRQLLERLRPRYLVGLTATPERSDGADLLSLCDRNLVFRAGLRAGLLASLLVPFHYYAVMDGLEYKQSWWRNGRLDEAKVTDALATRQQAAAALAALDERAPRAGRRLIVFCCSVRHANFMAAFLCEQGVAAAAVHSGQDSSPRAETLRRFRSGELAALTAVDLFNEGLDVPDINALLMLRPTDSPVVFLQQLGRGLRISGGKSLLTVVDMVGNHNDNIHRLIALRTLLDGPQGQLDVLRGLRFGGLDLPAQCVVEVPTQFVEVLERICESELEAECRPRVLAMAPPILMKVINAEKKPILRYTREERPDIPSGQVEVVCDGASYELGFEKISVNVARRPGGRVNVLADILRAWFGPSAGQPGRHDAVVLSRLGDKWRLEPVPPPAPIRHGVPLYRDLTVACGVGPTTHGEPRCEIAKIRTDLELTKGVHFVVRADGNSMDGGEAPIRDGDLVLCEWARNTPLVELQGRACVLAIDDGPEDTEFVIKVPTRDGDGWRLRSSAPEMADRKVPPGATLRVLARVLGIVYLA